MGRKIHGKVREKISSLSQDYLWPHWFALLSWKGFMVVSTLLGKLLVDTIFHKASILENLIEVYFKLWQCMLMQLLASVQKCTSDTS